VVLDLHAAAGCQNGFDNGGILNVCDWHTKEEYIDHSVELLGRLAERYRAEPALFAFEVLNEPRWDVPTEIPQALLRARLRGDPGALPPTVGVMFHDGFRDWREYLGFMNAPPYENVWFDVHRYQCFTPEDLEADIYEHLRKTVVDLRAEADAIGRELGLPTVCGEWSLGLKLQEVSLWADGPTTHPLEGLDAFQQEVALRGYAAAQLLTFERYRGWFFWNYKTETTPAWCLREAVARDLHRRFNVEVDPDLVLIVPGGKVTMYAAIRLFGEPGAEILYPDPGFPIYRSMIEHTGATRFRCRSARRTALPSLPRRRWPSSPPRPGS